MTAELRWTGATDTEFRATVRVLERLPWTEDFVDRENRRVAWMDILESQQFAIEGDGGYVLVRFAQALWTGREQKGGSLFDCLRRLDEGNLTAVLEAIQIRAGRR